MSSPLSADSHGNRAPSNPPRRGGAPRGRETRDAVADERTGRRRVGCGEKWQHEDVGVPEDVPAVPGAAEPLRPERRLGAIGDRGDQMEQREADGALEVRVSLDPDVGGRPATSPLRPLLGEQGLDSDPLGGLERLERRLGPGRLLGIGGVCHQTLQPNARGRDPCRALGCGNGDAAAFAPPLPAVADATTGRPAGAERPSRRRRG